MQIIKCMRHVEVTPDNQIRHSVHKKHILETCLNHLLDDTFGQVLSFFL
jgi:hypothetical protein